MNQEEISGSNGTSDEGLANPGSIAGVFVFSNGFHWLDWAKVCQLTECIKDEDAREKCWEEICRQWLGQLADDLGGSYRLEESEYFYYMYDVDPVTAGNIQRLAEHARSIIKGCIGDLINPDQRDVRGIIIALTEEDDYYQYISHYYPEGEYATSAGIHINDVLRHLVVNLECDFQVGSTLVHELAHDFLDPLPLPRWLHEGLAQSFERGIDNSYLVLKASDKSPRVNTHSPMVNQELVREHYLFWNEQNIQEFWAGTSFNVAGDASKLSYNLSEILTSLLSKNRLDFRAFISEASRVDSGQTAALNCLNVCLGDTLAGFLGPGAWRPVRKAMVDIWNKCSDQDMSDS